MKFDSITNIFKIADLRKRVLFTFFILFVFRIGSHIPTPGINTALLEQFFKQNAGTLLGYINMFSGGNFSQMTVFALGIMPYITAAIILELMTVVWPYLEKLQKEGELGRRKITQYTRWLTLILSIFQSLGIAYTLQKNTFNGAGFVISPGLGFVAMTVLTLTTGSIFVMWLGEQITDRGVGNGMSLLIFAGIIVGLPSAIGDLWTKVQTNVWGPFTVPGMLILLAFMLAVVAFIVWVERSERRIPVQYAKRVVGRKLMGGQSTHLPIRVNSGGVMPVIFAASILTFPSTAVMLPSIKNSKVFGPMLTALGFGEPLYTLIYVVAIIFFAYFYVSIIFNPVEVADNMRKYGGFIPGIRPGRHTSEYINTILTRITFVGAVYLVLVSLVPQFMITGTKFNHLPGFLGTWFANAPPWFLNGLNVNFYFGGVSLLIIVGVAMDTVQQVEAQLIMRHYEGFTARSSRIRGRRSYWA
ncbi:MAG: preprotein translocase subunit SecY [Acidobacteria bacterium]|nr:MAG: preprotein translocase subunit SecY [Acidobacteriota bacterium]